MGMPLQYFSIRWLAICGMTVAAASATGAGCPKATAGATMNWAGVVCESRAETDDFFSPAVQACLKRLVDDDHIQPSPSENCRLNKKLKGQLCTTWIKLGAEKTMQACMKSSTNVPREVSAGVGG